MIFSDRARTAPQTLTAIEAGRGIAACAVVLYHASRHIDQNLDTPLLRSVFQFGHAGVDFFFVISGFIILFVHYVDIGNATRFNHYSSRRLTRLLPTYWVALGLTIAAATAAGHGIPSPGDLLVSLSLCPSHREPLLGVAWTLQFEVLFYAVFAVLIVNRRIGLFILLIWLFLVTANLVVPLSSAGLPPQLYASYNLEFFLGMGVGYVVRNYTVPHPRLLAMTGIVIFTTIAVLENMGYIDGYHSLSRLAYGIPAALIILGLAEAERQRCLRVPQSMRALGGASYSIYLFQFIFIGALWQTLIATHLVSVMIPVSQFLVLAVAAITGGVAVSVLVERPLIRLTRSPRKLLGALRRWITVA